MDFTQVMMTVGLNSRAMPAQGLHMNISILYHLLLWTQSNHYSRTWLVYIFMGKLKMWMFELIVLDMDTQNCCCMAQYTQVWGTWCSLVCYWWCNKGQWCAGHNRCKSWSKHSEFFKADGYGKDSECRQSNIELLKWSKKNMRAHKKKERKVMWSSYRVWCWEALHVSVLHHLP